MRIRAIKIDVFEQKVYEVEMETGILNEYYKHIDCRLMDRVCPSTLKGGDAIFVDDEGLINERHYTSNGMKRGFTFTGYPAPLVGNGLLVGSDSEGDALSAETPLDVVIRSVSFGVLVPS